jgi:hypothetical protein
MERALVEQAIRQNYRIIGKLGAKLKEITPLATDHLRGYDTGGPLSFLSPEAQSHLEDTSPDSVCRVTFQSPKRLDTFVVATWGKQPIVAMHSVDIDD